MSVFMDRHFRYLKAGQKEYTEAEVRVIIDGAIQEEREACAQIAAYVLKMPENDVSAAIRARGQG